MRRIKISRVFPKYHPRAGEPTYFREKILNFLKANAGRPQIVEDGVSYKMHTIRRGENYKAGDVVILDEWTGLPYRSKTAIIATDVKIVKVIPIVIIANPPNIITTLNMEEYGVYPLWVNDGLTYKDFKAWFCDDPKSKDGFSGQILCFADPKDDITFYRNQKLRGY